MGKESLEFLSKKRAERVRARFGIDVDVDFLDVGGIKTHFISRGRGDPLILVHGGAGFTGCWFWLPCIGPLSRDFKVVALDLPGSGYSQTPSQLSISTLADFLGDFIDTLGFNQASIVGWSLGASIALSNSSRYNGQGRMVLVSVPGLCRKFVERRFLWSKIGKILVGTPPPNRWVVEWFLFSALAPYNTGSIEYGVVAELVDYLYELMGLPERVGVARRFFDLILEDHFRTEMMGALKRDFLLIGGKDDVRVPPDEVQAVSEIIPSFKLQFFERCGHAAPLEKTAEFISTVRNFLREGQ